MPPSSAPVIDETAPLALLAAYWQAPDGAKLGDPVFAALIEEALSDWSSARDAMLGLLLLSHTLIDEAGDGDALLARTGLRLAREAADG